MDQFIQHEKAKQARIQEAQANAILPVPAVPTEKSQIPIIPPLEASGPQLETVVPIEQEPQSVANTSQSNTAGVLLDNSLNRAVRRHKQWQHRVIAKVAQSYAMPKSVAISISHDFGRESPIALMTAPIRQALSPP